MTAQMLWVGGMSGVGKTTAARLIARRYDLCLYSVDAYTYAHRDRLDPAESPFVELVVHSTPEELADRAEEGARRRFELLLDNLRALPADAPVLVEGPQLLPELVAPLLPGPAHALFVTAEPAL